MKIILKLEEAAMFLACIGLLYIADAAWWWYLLLIIAPDISMIGYLAGNKAGAFSYNLFHHKGVAVLLMVIGVFVFFRSNFFTSEPDSQWLMLSGIALFGHSSMDRMFGYGLKYDKDFKYTHLGEIGNNKGHANDQ